MKTIKINEKRLEEILPHTIKETDALTNDAKKVLGTLLNYFAVMDFAKENRYIYLSNKILRQSCQIKADKMMAALQELMDTKLINRIAGSRRKKGQKATASEYSINWENLFKPVKKDFFGIFSDYIKPSETPLGIAATDADTDTASESESESVNINNNINIYSNNNYKISSKISSKISNIDITGSFLKNFRKKLDNCKTLEEINELKSTFLKRLKEIGLSNEELERAIYLLSIDAENKIKDSKL